MTQCSFLLWAGTQSVASWRLYSKLCPDGCEVHTPVSPRRPPDVTLLTGLAFALLF